MSRSLTLKFRLYIAGDTPNSVQALSNLTSLCQEHIPDRHEIEIINVLKDPKRALADGIILTPILVKVSPLPVQIIIGTLSQTQTVLNALGLEVSAGQRTGTSRSLRI